MTTRAPILPHLAWPLRLEGGRFAVLEQDSDEEVLQCVRVILATMQGERLERMDFGIPDPTFTVDVDEAAILAELMRLEPRVAAMMTTAPDRLDELVRTAVVTIENRGEA